MRYADMTPYKLIKELCDSEPHRQALVRMLDAQIDTHRQAAGTLNTHAGRAAAISLYDACVEAKELIEINNPSRINAQLRLMSPTLVSAAALLGLSGHQRAAIVARWDGKDQTGQE